MAITSWLSQWRGVPVELSAPVPTAEDKGGVCNMAKKQSQAGTPPGCELSEQATVGDVKRYLVRLLQRVDRGRVSVKKGNCLAQIANVLINAIVDHELEARVDELERLKKSGRLSTPTSITISAGAST